MGSRPITRVALVVLAGLLAGCGAGHSAAGHPSPRLPAAGPAHDPRPQAHPAGHSVHVGADPQGIAVDQSTGLVAVGVHNPSSVVLLDASTGRVVGSVPIAAAPRHLQAGEARGLLLVPEERADLLLELREPGNRRHVVRVGSFPHDAAQADGNIFVADERGGELTEIPAHGASRTIQGFTQPGGVAAAGRDVAVVDVAAFTLTLLDAVTGQRLGRLPAGQGPTHCVADATRIWVADTRGDEVITYSVHPFRRIGVTPVTGAPYGIALDRRHRRLWVTQTASNSVEELSVAGRLPRLIRSFATQLQPDTVAVDSASGRAYVADQVSGTVEMITPAT